MQDNHQTGKSIMAIILAVALAFNMSMVLAAFVGPTVTFVSNESRTENAASIINTTGGSITTVLLNATAQNQRWKAFVGNVTGSLTLDDANSYSIYDWSLGVVAGEVYATRSTQSILWTRINCSNVSHIRQEELAMNHTGPNDNISTTFNTQSHSGFLVGETSISANSCFSIRTYVNDTPQSTDFEELVLYDGNNNTNGSVIYTTLIENNVRGFNNKDYDFQMIVPENGGATWSSSTAYYFYVELT